MPVLQPCTPKCHASSTWGCDYPNSPRNGDIHFDGGGQNRFEVWNGSNWVHASFAPGTLITIERPDPWMDLIYEIGSNGTSFTNVTDSICGNDASEIVPDEHRVVVQRCVTKDCPEACDCLDGPQKPEGIPYSTFVEALAKTIFMEACFDAPTEFSGCGDNKSLRMFEDPANPGCWKFGVLDAVSQRVFTLEANDGELNKPNGNYEWPTDFPRAYTRAEFFAVDNQGSGTVDESRIADNVITGGTFTLACAQTFNMTQYMPIIKKGTVGDAYSDLTETTVRWQVNGGPWQYRRFDAPSDPTLNNRVAFYRGFNAVNTEATIETPIELPAGEIRIQLLAFARRAAQATPLDIHSPPVGSGIPSFPDLRFTPILD